MKDHRNANHHHDQSEAPPSPRSTTWGSKAVNLEHRHGLPNRPQTETRQAPVQMDTPMGLTNHNAELLKRIQVLEREISRSRVEHENDQNILLDKYAWLETQFWNLQNDYTRTGPTVTRLNDMATKTDAGLSKALELLKKLEEKVVACDKAMSVHQASFSGIRDQQDSIRHLVEKQKDEIEEIQGESQKAKMVMSRLASIAELLKH
jgi:chromosome segregation ATPase